MYDYSPFRHEEFGGEGLLDRAQKIVNFSKKGLNLASGPAGTFISNALSERFNKNPDWRPGFSGEQHLVMKTPHGLTRGNYCG